MQSFKQKKKKLHSSSSDHSEAMTSAPSKKRLLIILAAIVLILGGGVIYYAVTQNSVLRRSGVEIPQGWREYNSTTYGVSFIMPDKWKVNEPNLESLNNGPTATGGSIAVLNPKDQANGYSIGVFKGKLGSVISQQLTANGIENAGYSANTASLKWRGYDATKLTLTTKSGEDEKKASFTMLYVQVSNYVFLLPDKYETSAARKNTKITKEDYTKFADSIRIDSAVIDSQANKVAKSADLPKAKDINLGTVTIPEGWKKFESSVRGISFVIPNAWEVKEQVEPSEGAALGLTIGSSSSFENSAVIVVVKTKLDEFMSQSGYTGATESNGKSTSKVEKLKWQGYEARRVKLSSPNDKDAISQSALFVGIGDSTYIIPDPTSSLSGVSTGRFDTKEYKTFVESVRIKES